MLVVRIRERLRRHRRILYVACHPAAAVLQGDRLRNGTDVLHKAVPRVWNRASPKLIALRNILSSPPERVRGRICLLLRGGGVMTIPTISSRRRRPLVVHSEGLEKSRGSAVPRVGFEACGRLVPLPCQAEALPSRLLLGVGAQPEPRGRSEEHFTYEQTRQRELPFLVWYNYYSTVQYCTRVLVQYSTVLYCITVAILCSTVIYYS